MAIDPRLQQGQPQSNRVKNMQDLQLCISMTISLKFLNHLSLSYPKESTTDKKLEKIGYNKCS